VDLFRPDISPHRPIRSDFAHLLAIAFGLTVADVTADARDVATWQARDDDPLLTSIEARRRLDAANTAIYVRILRTALSTYA
jgi:hypothetical protein